MKSTLFPYTSRYLGWPLLTMGLILGLISFYFEIEFSWLDVKVLAIGGESNHFFSNEEPSFFSLMEDNFTNELIALLILIGAVLVAFSKEKVEDEFFQQLRFEAMIWALKIQSLLLLLAILFLYNFAFLWFMMIALVSFYVIYIGRYHFQLMKFKRETRAE